MLLLIIASVLALTGIGTYAFLSQPSFGRRPASKRLERILQSPNYRNGMFRNQLPTPLMTGDKNRWQIWGEFIFASRKDIRPDFPLTTIRTNLKQLSSQQNLAVWFGHSSYFLQTDGRRILVDPVFCEAAPVSFVNKPFPGTDIFHPDDMPSIDVLIITHDHWDHLDYKTVKALQKKVRTVICPLGVGEYFAYWGYDETQIVELDWTEHARFENLVIHCLPARHFSGRGLTANQTLWASFLIEAPSLTVFIGGDGGYGPHFKEIASHFPKIDWAFLENGQYSENWRFIHTMPSQLEQVARDLKARHVVTVHHSKYALSRHPWDEPLKTALSIKAKGDIRIFLPKIGEILPLTAQ